MHLATIAPDKHYLSILNLLLNVAIVTTSFPLF